jgi:hypothetical protein
MEKRRSVLKVDREALATIAEFLLDSGYLHAVSRLTLREPFPKFDDLQAMIGESSPFHKLALSLFLQGHPIAERFLRRVIPDRVVSACLSTGILCVNHLSEYCTGGRAITAQTGLTLLAELPHLYPTATAPEPPKDETASLLPLPDEPVAFVRGKTCLVVESAPSWKSSALLAAARGASAVTAVVPDPELRECVAISAHLSGLGAFVELLEKLPEPNPARSFDYIAESRLPGAPIDSASSLRRKFEELCRRAAPSFSGRLDCCAEGVARKIVANESVYELARSQDIAVQSVVLDKFLRPAPASSEAERMTHFFNQTLLFKRTASTVGGVVTIPLYDSKRTDPLVSLVARYRSAC